MIKEKHLIKSQTPTQEKILLKLAEKNLQIIVIFATKNDTIYKNDFNDTNMPPVLQAFFDNIQELYQHIVSHKPETFVFKVKNESVENPCLSFEIQVATKLLRKQIPLKEIKSEQLYKSVNAELEQIQKISQVKKRIQEKKKRIEQLKNKLSQASIQIQEKQADIKEYHQAISRMIEQKNNHQNQIQMIRSDFQMKNSGILASKPQTGKVTASTIFAAMPTPCIKHKFGKNIELHRDKKCLFLKNKEVTDDDIQSMEGFDWSEIQILSLGANKLTNKSLQTLGQISDWQNVSELYLFANPITDISKLRFLPQLQLISIYDLQLNEASCNYLCSTKFPKLRQIYLNFEQKNIDKFWLKIIGNQFKNFPVLKKITVDNPEKISSQTRVKINKMCTSKNIELTLGNPNTVNVNCNIY